MFRAIHHYGPRSWRLNSLTDKECDYVVDENPWNCTCDSFIFRSNCVHVKIIKLMNQIIRNLQINTVIDVGASDGRWSKETLQSFPNASYILIEPLNYPNTFIPPRGRMVKGIAGDQRGHAMLNVSQDMWGSGVYGQDNGTKVEQYALDELVTEPGPYFLKLDTHGYESEIFTGASRILKNAQVLLIECYNHKFHERVVPFEQVVQRLGEIGFRVFDMYDFLRRKKYNDLWQMDILFLRADHPVFQDKNYE